MNITPLILIADTTNMINRVFHSQTFVEGLFSGLLSGLVLGIIFSKFFGLFFIFLRNITFKNLIKLFCPNIDYSGFDKFINETNYCYLDYKNKLLCFNNFQLEKDYRDYLTHCIDNFKRYIRREIINKTVGKDAIVSKLDNVINTVKGYKISPLITGYIDREKTFNSDFGFNITKFNFKSFGIAFLINELPEKMDLESFVQRFYDIQQEFIVNSIDFLEKEKSNYTKLYLGEIISKKSTI